MAVFEYFLSWKSQLAKMGLSNNPLVGSWLNFGQFVDFNPQLSPKRKALNRLILLIVLFNLMKLMVISLAAWLGFPDLKLWLLDLYLFDENDQKFFDIAHSVMYFGLYIGYSYWVALDGNVVALNSFRFLLIPEDPKDRQRYAERYQLDSKSINKFFSLYRLASKLLRLMIVIYSTFELAVISRCLYHSFYALNLAYFLSLALFLWAFTFVAYVILIFFIISRLVLMLLSAQFFIHRAKGINALIYNRFIKTELPFASGPKKIRKKAGLLRILRLLSDFCRQFQQINSVLDSSVSVFLLGMFGFMFLLPFFLLFVKNDLAIQLFFGVMPIVLYILCFSFSIFNDRLKGQVSL